VSLEQAAGGQSAAAAARSEGAAAAAGEVPMVAVESPSATRAAGEPLLLVASGPHVIARTAADLLIGWLAEALAMRGEAHVALTGGSSARGLYMELREPGRRAAIDWTRVHLWFGDDRFVPTTDPECNSGLAQRTLLAPGGPAVPRDHVHPVPADAAMAAGEDQDWAAAAYARQILLAVPATDGVPAFDVVLLGMGSDAHILSVFPGSAALESGAPVVLGVPAPTHIAPHLPRVTLSPAVLPRARHLLVLVPGAAKAAVVAAVFGAERDPTRWPAQLAIRDNATWLLDAGSSTGLTLR
jgi:6-phosphogluconolactonase